MMSLDDRLGDGQTQPGPTPGMGSRRVHAIKPIENVRQVPWGNTEPLVFDLETGMSPGRGESDLDRRPRIGIRRGVVQKYDQHLLEPVPVACHMERPVRIYLKRGLGME